MSDDESVDGPKIVADILNSMNPDNREKIVRKIKEADPGIALKIEDNLYRFDDIAELTDKSIQVLAQNLEHKDLVLALKAASKEVKEALYSNISKRKVEMLEQDLNSLPPTKLKEVESAQKRVLETVEKLREEGKVISRLKDDITA